MSKFIRAPSSNFPSDILKWMKVNAKPKMALKLMKCHKYFQHFPEFPYFVVKDVEYAFDIYIGKEVWHYQTLNGKCYPVFGEYIEGIENIENLTQKLWIVERLSVSRATIFGSTISQMRATASAIIQKIAVCDVKLLNLDNICLSLNEFKFLTASGTIEEFCFYDAKITFENDDSVGLGEILQNLPNLKEFRYSNYDNCVFSEDFFNAFKKIKTIKLESIYLNTRKFEDLNGFSNFINKYPSITSEMEFLSNSLTKEEEKIVEKFIQDIIDAGINDYYPPNIIFDGQSEEQREALDSLIQTFCNSRKMTKLNFLT